MLIASKFLAPRRSGEEVTYQRYFPGHGGDVWACEHSNGDIAAYCISELEKVSQKLNPKTNPKRNFNINQYIYVKLSEKGRKIYFQHYGINKKPDDEVGALGFPKWNVPDREGYVKFQFHEFLRIFGSHTGCDLGGGDYLDSMVVRFEEEDLWPEDQFARKED